MSYICTLENVKDTLEKYGVAVIENVLSIEECDSIKEKAWKELNKLTSRLKKPIDINDSESWKSLYELFPIHSMLIQHYSVGHMQWCWDVRQNENVVNVFSKLWNTKNEDLLSSFDGISVHFPPEKTKRGWFRKNNWIHTDQSSFKKGLQCIQGFVSLYDVNEHDATLRVLQKSHNFHESFFKDFDIEEKKDWFKLEEEHYEYFANKGCEMIDIKCKAGSIVLWDSRTFHQGKEPDMKRGQENFRLISYVCMLPRKLASTKDLEKKKKAFNDLRMTSHWPHKPKLFAKNPRTYGKELPTILPVDKPLLTDLGKKLAGF